MQEPKREMLYIPDTMESWPWPRMANPLEDATTKESLAWVSRFSFSTPKRRNYTDLLIMGCGGE